MKTLNKPILDAASCYAAALRLLTRREHSQVELKRKLQQRGYQTADIQQVLLQLSERDWQSDERYAQSALKQRVSRGDGPIKIRAYLKQQGVSDEVIAHSVAQLQPDWLAQAKQQHAKLQRLHPNWQVPQMMRALAQRGYNLSQIQQILQHDPED